MAQPAFRSGGYNTAYLASEFRGTARAEDARDAEDAAVLAALHAATSARAPGVVSTGSAEGPSRWRTAGRTFPAPPRSR